MPYTTTFTPERDQLRGFKNKVHRKLWPRRQDESESIISPSTPQSESSTLVNFALDDSVSLAENQDVAAEAYDERYLEFDNCAWGTKRHGSPVVPRPSRRHPRANAEETASEYQMISPEDQGWTAPAASPASRRRLAALRRPAKGPSDVKMGIKPELLDFEDRAWM